jgi:hypothetical protein
MSNACIDRLPSSDNGNDLRLVTKLKKSSLRGSQIPAMLVATPVLL